MKRHGMGWGHEGRRHETDSEKHERDVRGSRQKKVKSVVL